MKQILAAVALMVAGCGSNRPVSLDGEAAVCPNGLTNCVGKCVDTATDHDNCGACGYGCGLDLCCEKGLCRTDCVLPPGMTACAGSLVDIRSDNDNCGSCGNKCDTSNGFTCQGGACACVSSLTDCSGMCVNTENDPDNCGGCGSKCGGYWCNGKYLEHECQTGLCGGCPATLTECAGSCVDLNSDNSNCGACCTECDTANGFICQSGKCSCVSYMTDCNGQCVDINTDPTNCGSCGTVCPANSLGCTLGICDCLCGGSTMTRCGSPCKCANLSTDNNNCGACGAVCTGGKTCQNGTCACSTGLTDCNGTCVDTSTDPTNCGSCGTACPSGVWCSAGGCGNPCPGIVCNVFCIDPLTDNVNCGGCNVVCTGGKLCQFGVCVCPTNLPHDCYGTCVHLDINKQNCGACGVVCAITEVCLAGSCVPSPVVALTVVCPSATLPAGTVMQCTAAGTLQNGNSVPLTASVTWSAANNGLCAGSAGTISNGPPSTDPAGTFTAVTVGCKANVAATYASGSTTITSNFFVVTVTN